MRLRSLRIRMPASLVSVALLTSLVMSLAIAGQTFFNLRDDQTNSVIEIAHALSPTLVKALRHDDIWSAYATLRGPAKSPESTTGDLEPGFRILFDDESSVFASDQPARFPVGESLLSSEPLRKLLSIELASPSQREAVVARHDGRQIALLALFSEDARIGTLLVAGPKGAFIARLVEILRGGAIVVALIVATIVPLGWLWGRRMVAPLVELARCMDYVGKRPLTEIQCPFHPSADEIGQLGERFQNMLEDLKEKEQLEKQMIIQGRLAAVGRIAGGVAHEINNPLAGMLLAIDNYRTAPEVKCSAEKTLGLVERGLEQIRETVSALLVECRVEQREFTQDDLDDIRTLIHTRPEVERVDIQWDAVLYRSVPIPATGVRQILLNLCLNALQAMEGHPEDRVEVNARLSDELLRIYVADNGPIIDQEVIEHIFEPFHSKRPGGTGLGLWITYESVRQLGGEIQVNSKVGWTEFVVKLPLRSYQETT